MLPINHTKKIKMKAFAAINISRLRKGFCLGSFLMATLLGSSQLQSQADLSITSVTIAEDIAKREGSKSDANTSFGNLKCTITIHNGSGGQARQIKIAVILPVDITVVSVVSDPNIFTEYRSGNGNRGGWPGSLLLDLHNLAVGGDKIIEITFTRSAHGNKIGAYVFSGCPDPDPANNYKETTY
jgi:hypothetical protein